jgi:hypothetical protein
VVDIFLQESAPEDNVGPFGIDGEVVVHHIIDQDLPRFRLLGARELRLALKKKVCKYHIYHLD